MDQSPDTLRKRPDQSRSLRISVRNPILELPSVRQIMDLPPEAQQALASLLLDLSRDARQRAETSWRRHKAPMAAYWESVSVYAVHASRLMRTAEGSACAKAL